MKYTPTKRILAILGGISLTISGSSLAAIVVHGSTTAYQETGGDWLSMGTNDIDGSGGLGTDGWVFAGVSNGSAFNTTSTGNSGVFNAVSSLPTYVTAISQGATHLGTSYGLAGYSDIDDPVALDGTDSESGFWIERFNNTSNGNTTDLLNFTISGITVGQTVRVGVLSATGDNANWAPTSLSLTDGGSTVTVGDHGGTQLGAPAGTINGWVFFDLDADGDYTVQGTDRNVGQGAGIGGVTFDSQTIPEPSSAALIGLGIYSLLFRRRR